MATMLTLYMICVLELAVVIRGKIRNIPSEEMLQEIAGLYFTRTLLKTNLTYEYLYFISLFREPYSPFV